MRKLGHGSQRYSIIWLKLSSHTNNTGLNSVLILFPTSTLLLLKLFLVLMLNKIGRLIQKMGKKKEERDFKGAPENICKIMDMFINLIVVIVI